MFKIVHDLAGRNLKDICFCLHSQHCWLGIIDSYADSKGRHSIMAYTDTCIELLVVAIMVVAAQENPT